MLLTTLIYSIIMIDNRTGQTWAIETDISQAECEMHKPQDTKQFTFTCEGVEAS